MKKITVRQVKSSIGISETQVKTLVSLGLGKLGKKKELEDTPTVRGQIVKVAHLIVVE